VKPTQSYRSFRRGLAQPSEADLAEMDARYREVLGWKVFEPQFGDGTSVTLRPSESVYRARGDGLRRNGFSVDKD